ncbi:DegV family protein, partial [Aquipuribacter sp. SD81]|uniref:DegV family protein n=1 Tax=Aquipuribacter sp. SD81 TaxID=3127703 RepID=UPI00301603D4
MRRTAVVTDSTARMGGAPVPHPGDPWAPEAAVATVELDVLVDGEPRRETDQPVADLLTELGRGRRTTTSRPSPDGFTAAYAQVADAGASAAVSVHLSGALSGTVDAAQAAAAGAPVRVGVVDTRTVGG